MRTVPQPQCPNCDADGNAAHVALRDKVYGAPGSWNMRRCGNAACGSYWLDPAPHADDLAIAYAHYHTHEAEPDEARDRSLVSSMMAAYVGRRLGLETTGGRLPRLSSGLAPILHQRAQSALYAHFYLPYRRQGKVLEIGCGAGRQLETLVHDGWQATGIDFDPEAVAVARARGLDVLVGDVRRLDLPLEGFDAIVMAQVLEHVFAPVALLERCRALLKPGGRLISITPNADSLGHRLFGRDWRGLEPPRHLVIYTRRALGLACERAGLTVERIDVSARDAANLLLASERIRRAPEDGRITRPSAARRPPLHLRLLASVERFGILAGAAWGEELVLTARK